LLLSETPTERKVVGEKYDIKDFSHLKELRDYMVRGPQEFCIERSRLLTRFLKEKGDLDYTDPFTRQAEGLKYILENKRANIFPHELLAGSSTSKRRGVLFYPEFLGGGIWPEILMMSERKTNKYHITLKEVMELDGEILPFWTHNNLMEAVRHRLGDHDKAYRLQELLFLYMVSKYNCQSHTIPDYSSVLEKGMEGLISEAKEKMKNADKSKKIFYQALITVMEGVITYANGLSAEASRQADECEDETRRCQLEKMAEICKTVPAKPATCFWEALQSIWTTMNALYQEQNNIGFSIGRIDQLLNKFYLNDLENNLITRKEAIELLAHFWVKVGDNLPMVPEQGDILFAGTGSNQAITIGGCDKGGKNAINETTYLCLDVTEMVAIRDPNVNARVREDDPPEYTRRLAEVIINTGATPSLINDTVAISALKKIGISLEDARDFSQVGCLEPSSTAKQFGHTGAILINTIAALVLALNNGDAIRAKDVGLRTGDLSSFKTYEQFKEAVLNQLSFMIKHSTRLNNACGEELKYIHPQPLLSALFEGPMESGVSLLEGGATYNSSGIAFIALADLTDSLYAIKKLVYDDKKLTLPELKKICEANFKGYDEIYNYVINKLDHFGNNIEEVDSIAKELVAFLYDETTSKKNYRNGVYSPGYWSMTIHSGFGQVTGAFPHGKKHGKPLTSGLTPFSYAQRKGPTAVMNSLAFLNSSKMPNGMALNLKFNRFLFKDPEKIDLIASLVKGYFMKGGMQVQFTIQDASTLIDAKKHPENYPDLMVRISGYTAYFADLNDHMKDEIINRAIMDI